MVKAYLRYEPLATFGVIASTLANVLYDQTGKIAIAPALEEVVLWDLKKGTQVKKRFDETNITLFSCNAYIYIHRLESGENLETSPK